MESIIRRHIKKEIEEHLPEKEITIITGARQVGKTTILLQIMEDLKTKNKNVLFLNLDIDTDSKHFASQETLLQKIRLEIGDEGYVFIDEIQRLENAGLFLKGLYDRNLNYKFIISGSGSLDLKAKISESLLGRKRVIEMQSVSFEEFVNFKTNYKYENKLNAYFEIEHHQTMLFLNEYLNFGGYPRVVIETRLKDKLVLIDEILKSYIEKDLVYLLNIERPDAFKGLIKILSAHSGNIINYSSIASQLNLSVQTLKKYLWFAEKTFSISYVSPFYTNKVKELTKSPVYYFNDLGFRNYAINQMGNLTMNQQFGFVFQNFVFLILREYIKWKNFSIHYWRTTDKAEVDFIINKTNDVLPVEVKYGNFSKPAISRSFRSFIEKYNPQNAWIINRNFEAEVKINDTSVRFIPFYKIALQQI